MRLRSLLAALLIWLAPTATLAEGDQAGAFDYYVLALSWNAAWCTREGDARGAAQCDPRLDLDFTLHGLWPQHEQGYPAYCRTSAADPSRSASLRMADIMGSSGLAWHQWKKHGRCSGLSAADYYALSREAYAAITRPDIFQRLPRDMTLPPDVVEAAFLEANPTLTADGVTVTCRDGMVQEVRVCLTKTLEPRTCGADVVRDCPAKTITMPMMR